MAHLRNRFCLVPFSELTDCPRTIHHAIGSPHFDTQGNPLFADPIVIAVRANITDPELPHCTALGASCNTRPYQSYGPVMRTVFDMSKPHENPPVRLGLEGVMEVGQVRSLPREGLLVQADSLLLGCVSPMTGTTNREIVKLVLENLAKEFGKMPHGSTLRLPLIGTGSARQGETTEEIFRETVSLTAAHFAPYLLPDRNNESPRRLLLVHPFEAESHLISTMLAEKGIFLTLLDKLGTSTVDPRVIYGLGHGEKPDNQLVNAENFEKALNHFDSALDQLLEKKTDEAMREAARGVEVEPQLRGMFNAISSFVDRKEGLLGAITREALHLARSGKIRDAFSVAQALYRLGGGDKQRELVESLRRGYMHSSIAALEARLLYEQYMETEEGLKDIHQGGNLADTPGEGSGEVVSTNLREDLLRDQTSLKELEQKIPRRIIENTYHIVIRKLMADKIETHGATRALDNLRGLAEHQKVLLPPEDEARIEDLYKLINFYQDKKTDKSVNMRKHILNSLESTMTKHGTFRLEAARYHLQTRREEGDDIVLTRQDILESWKSLETGFHYSTRDYGILSYLGFLVLSQGSRFISKAKEFYSLMLRLLEEEVSHGRFSMVKLKDSGGEEFFVPHQDIPTQAAFKYYQDYHHLTRCMFQLTEALEQMDGGTALALYKDARESLQSVGRHDLVQVFEDHLGEQWINLMCRHVGRMGSIPTPFGEISLDFARIIYQKFRYWWRYSGLTSGQLRDTMVEFIERLGKKIKKG